MNYLGEKRFLKAFVRALNAPVAVLICVYTTDPQESTTKATTSLDKEN